MNADIPSFFLMIIFISASLAIAVTLIARSGESDGTGFWARARSVIWFSVVPANLLLSAVFVLFLLGIL
jgi:hypothetical protein